MPPQIALLFCIIFILFLFKMDYGRRPGVSNAIWIPSIWIMIIGSRPVSLWLDPSPATEMDIISGNPIDRTIFIILIITGILILLRRRISYLTILKTNSFVVLFLMYSGISILWSDFPFVSFKRWIKEIGTLVMVLVVLTDADPSEALRRMIRRCAYVLIPLSVVLIKYYPYLGRGYDPWSGAVAYKGIATSKNMLGNLCLVCGLFFSWDLLVMRGKRNLFSDKKEVFLNTLLLVMTLWLLIKSSSATSLLSLVMGVCIILAIGFPIIKRNQEFIGVYIFIAVGLLLVFQSIFDISQLLISNMGRDMTLTGRTDLWSEVLSMVENPLIGAGYDSFWLGARLEKLWSMFWWHPIQAHNGYIEIYLNLGVIGLFLLVGVIFSSYRKIRRTLMFDFEYGRLRMAFLVAVLIVGASEGVFKGISIVWIIFLLIVMGASGISHLPAQGQLKQTG